MGQLHRNQYFDRVRPTFNSFEVADNTVTSNAVGGIVADAAEPVLITRNTVANNGLMSWQNPILDSGGVAIHDGIHARGSAVTVSLNQARGNGSYGIAAYFAKDGGGNVASHNGQPTECLGVQCAGASASSGPLVLGDMRFFGPDCNAVLVTAVNVGDTEVPAGWSWTVEIKALGIKDIFTGQQPLAPEASIPLFHNPGLQRQGPGRYRFRPIVPSVTQGRLWGTWCCRAQREVRPERAAFGASSTSSTNL
jgi:hypothetical protein